jgi:hypothetical protein
MVAAVDEGGAAADPPCGDKRVESGRDGRGCRGTAEVSPGEGGRAGVCS